VRRHGNRAPAAAAVAGVDRYYYLRQGGYVIVVVFSVVCFFVCLSVSNLAQKNVRTDLHEIFREGWQWNGPVNK